MCKKWYVPFRYVIQIDFWFRFTREEPIHSRFVILYTKMSEHFYQFTSTFTHVRRKTTTLFCLAGEKSLATHEEYRMTFVTGSTRCKQNTFTAFTSDLSLRLSILKVGSPASMDGFWSHHRHSGKTLFSKCFYVNI